MAGTDTELDPDDVILAETEINTFRASLQDRITRLAGLLAEANAGLKGAGITPAYKNATNNLTAFHANVNSDLDYIESQMHSVGKDTASTDDTVGQNMARMTGGGGDGGSGGGLLPTTQNG